MKANILNLLHIFFISPATRVENGLRRYQLHSTAISAKASPANTTATTQHQQANSYNNGVISPSNSKLNSDIISRRIRKCGNNWQLALSMLDADQGKSVPTRAVRAVLHLLGKNGRYQEAIDLYKGHRHQNDEELCRRVISAVGSAKQWELAVELLHDFSDSPSVMLYNSAVAACGKAGAWEEALRLLNDSEDRFQEVDVENSLKNSRISGYEAALTVLARNKRYSEALLLLEKMRQRGVSPNVNTYNLVLLACSKAAKHTDAIQILCEMLVKGGELSPNANSYELVMCACGKVGAWKEASLIEDMMINPKSRHEISSILCELTENVNNFSVARGSSTPYFWYFEGLDRFGSGKHSWWKIGDLKFNAVSSDDDVSDIVIGISSHRNPRRYGQTLMFFDHKGNKLGFVLVKQSKIDPAREIGESHLSSRLVGMLVEKRFRGKGLSSLFMAVWLNFCIQFGAVPSAEKINKPLLALALQHKFGFHPTGGGIGVEISPLKYNSHILHENEDLMRLGSREPVVLYSPSRSFLHGAFSSGELKKQGMMISQHPPSPRCPVVQVKTCFHFPSYDARKSEELMKMINRVLYKQNYDVVLSPATIENVKQAFFGAS